MQKAQFLKVHTLIFLIYQRPGCSTLLTEELITASKTIFAIYTMILLIMASAVSVLQYFMEDTIQSWEEH